MAHKLDSFSPGSAMVVVAHPDDAEFMCAGTVAKWAKAGCEVTYVLVTNGNKGSDDPDMTSTRLAEIREAEQRAAGAILGVKHFEFLGFPDGYLVHTLDVRREITRVIRKWKPEVVITFDPSQRFFGDSYPNHPDHRATGDATIDAIFPSARDRLTFPELLVDGYEPWKVRQIWLASDDQHSQVRVDISETIAAKQAALLAHPSQLGADAVEMALQMGRWGAAGRDFEFGEAFRVITLDTPFDEVQGEHS
ncbi:MAG: PIG-L deacetylase family protein [Dehalococcoidia bacterium]